MFELIFGLFWTGVTAIVTLAMYAGSGNISVNGQPVSQAEFNAMLWPKLFLGFFWIIGLFMLFLGIKKLLVNMKTSVKGIKTYGVVLDILETNCSSNGRPQLKAEVMVVMPDKTTRRFQEVIGFDYNKYRIGEALLVKQCDNDINILGIATHTEIPYEYREMIDGIRQEYGCSMEHVSARFGGGERVYQKLGGGSSMDTGSRQTGFGYVVDDFDDFVAGREHGGNTSRNSGYHNDGYTTHTVNLDGDGYGASSYETTSATPNNEVQHIDNDTVIINGVEYRRNS